MNEKDDKDCWWERRGAVAAAREQECLTKLKEARAGFTQLSCDPRLVACAAATEILRCESLPIFPEF
jgi:hypothetical protein